jgi:hypothetical protein
MPDREPTATGQQASATEVDPCASIDTGGFFELDVDALVPEVGIAARF